MPEHEAEVSIPGGMLDLVNLMQQVASKNGRDYLSRREFQRETGISDKIILRYFDSWNELLVRAGLNIAANKKLGDDELFNDMHAYFQHKGGATTLRRFQADGPHSISVYLRRWGSWQSTIDQYRLWLEGERRSPNSNISQNNVRKPRAENGRQLQMPSSTSTTVVSRNRSMQYGDFLNFRGLQHAPINELGGVFLFGMVARELGYVVEAVKPDFPDCEAKRHIGKGRWQRVRIEFEFQSRNFRDHGHHEHECDLIVCWEHNWPECLLEVLELRSALATLPSQ